jgi:hypothetical protein
MSDALKRQLDAHYEAIIARLRAIAPQETQELLGVMAARDAYLAAAKPASTSLPYVYYDSVIEAILHWLKERGGTATEEEIVQGVLDGGLQLHSPRRELNVRDSIRFHTSPKNEKVAKLKRVGRKISAK